MVRSQNRVKATLASSSVEVSSFIEQHPDLSRTALARGLCSHFDFHDPKGKPQVASCLRALRELADGGAFTLPASRSPVRSTVATPCDAAPIPLPAELPTDVQQIGELRLIYVVTKADRTRWKQVMEAEHPYGKRPLVGRQIRYLVESDHGLLAAVGFAAAARRLAARDRWIGWSETQRADHLDHVVCLSRLLIRGPAGSCANLGSKVLGLAVAALRRDFAERYGYVPWLLETFVEADQHDGASLRAANWTCVGQTAGRGRQDRKHAQDQGVKDIYLLAMQADFRTELGLPERFAPLELADQDGTAQGTDGWAEAEFAGAPLGDMRLSRRLVSIAQAKASLPGQPFLEAVSGGAAEKAGYYRFVDQPDDSAVCMDNILAPHRERTLRRMRTRAANDGHLLCVHDTTDLNYSTLLACERLGVIGLNQTGTESGGLRLHTSYVVSAEEGLPLGLFAWDCYAPELKPERKKIDSRYIPIEQKETHRWIGNLQLDPLAVEATDGLGITHVMDREGDFFELFHAWREQGRGELLVRASHNRAQARQVPTGEEKPLKLFDAVAAEPVQALIEVEIPRKSSRKKVAPRRRRQASIELRWKAAKTYPPSHGLSRHLAPVDLWILEAREVSAPGETAKPILWRLLSSEPIGSEQDAVRLLDYYAKRWRIEDWHRILKTCCRVEEPAHRDAECLKRLIAINMVIAWRIHLMCLLGREVPTVPAEVLFSDVELEVLALVSRDKGWDTPSNLGEAVITVARMGGYLNRKNDPPPGTEILWRGTRQLTLLAKGFLLARLE